MTAVFDTNVVVSALVFRGGSCAPLLRCADAADQVFVDAAVAAGAAALIDTHSPF